MKKPVIGAHVSAAGGASTAIPRAKAIGAEAIQIFGASPRQWAVRMPAKEEIAAFRSAVRHESIQAVFLHAPYLINLGSADAKLRERSADLLEAHFRIAHALGADGLIFHVGAASAGMFRKEALREAARLIKRVLSTVKGNTCLCIENAAGNGKIGGTLEEIACVLDAVGSKRAGVCIDTAHAFEEGIVSAYDRKGVEEFAQRIGKTIGWERVRAVHANDSKTAHSSRHDRHENIGKGYIGTSGFRELLKHPKFRAIPFILEVPGRDGNGPDKWNVGALKACLLR